jgi:hypothetical protein
MKFDWHHLWHLLRPFEYLLTFGLGSGAVAFRRYWQKLRENKASGWPSADAIIQSAEVKAHEGYDVRVTYRYYAGQEYRYGKYSRHFRKKDAANEFADAIRGRNVPIRYREDNPSVSVLVERDLELAGILQGQLKIRA